jgi:hypothetical protein
MFFFVLLLLVLVRAFSTPTTTSQRFTQLTELASHSECWKSAVESLVSTEEWLSKHFLNFFPPQHSTCSRLTEETRRVLALNLLSCHLESNGRSKVDTDDASRLSDVQFQLFTQFFIEIDSICWNVAQALYQERAAQTIALLHDASALASDRLSHIANATEQLTQSLKTLSDWNDRIERFSTKTFLAWVGALFSVFFVTSLSPHLIGARSPCTALVIAAACIEWQASNAWSADELQILRASAGATALFVLWLVRLCSISAQESQEKAFVKKLNRAAAPMFEKNWTKEPAVCHI